MAFAEQNGQLVRGHTLLWHNQLPDWLTTGVANGTISRTSSRPCSSSTSSPRSSRYGARSGSGTWPTSSSPTPIRRINPNDFWISNLGADIIPQAFRWAHEADPHALLFYNDYNIARRGRHATPRATPRYAWLQQMMAQGVPIHGVGNQGHLDTQYGFPTRMTQDFQRFASLGLKVAITEADVRTFVDGPTTQVPTDNLATFAQPYEFSQMLKAGLACPSASRSPSGASATRTPGFPGSSPVRATPPCTT